MGLYQSRIETTGPDDLKFDVVMNGPKQSNTLTDENRSCIDDQVFDETQA